jgi:hypothetical protein
MAQEETKNPLRSRNWRNILFLVMGLIALVLFVLVLRKVFDRVEPIDQVVSEETAWLIEPLAEDGLVDYHAHLQSKLSAGVTEENNAARVIFQAVGAQALPAGVRDRVWQRLGLDPAAADTDAYTDLVDFADDYPPEDLPPGLQISDEARKRMIELKNKIREQIDTYGLADEKVIAEYLEAREGSLAGAMSEQLEAATTKLWDEQDYPQLAQWLGEVSGVLDQVLQATARERFYLPMVDFGEKGPANLVSTCRVPRELMQELGLALLARSMRKDREDWNARAADIVAVHRLGRLVLQNWSMASTEAGMLLDHSAARTALALATLPESKPTFLGDFQQRLAGIEPAGPLAPHYHQGVRLMTLDYVNLVWRGRSSFGQAIPEEQLAQQRALIDWNQARREFNDWFDRLMEIARIEDAAKRKEAAESFDERLEARLTETARLDRERQSLWGRLSALVNSREEQRKGLTRSFTDSMIGGAHMLLSRRWGLINAGQESEARRALAQLTAAVRRRQAATGRYPERLDTLTEDYIASVPVDPFTGQAMHYKRTDTGFLLYSVGVDLADNGGDEQEDLVVRYPSGS